MNLIESLVLLALSVGLLVVGRGRTGEGLAIFRRLPWVVGQLFGMTILYLFAAGLMGVAAKSALAQLRIACDDPPFPAALVCQGTDRMLCRGRRRRTGACLHPWNVADLQHSS